MRIAFMGTPDFATVALDALVGAGHDVAGVWTRAPQPAGRGHRMRPSPVHARADALGLSVRHPDNFRSPVEQLALAAQHVDVAVVVAYGVILPQAVLDTPARGCLNIHASLLPRWRGAAPIQRAIMAGDRVTGISIMQMEAGLDTGPVLLTRETPITEDDTAADLHDRLAALGAEGIVDALARLSDLPPMPQDDVQATYAAKITSDESRIDWTLPADQVARHIRGLSPFPGAWCMADDERLKLLHARAIVGRGAPGAVLGIAPFVVACGTGAVEIGKLQRPGRRAMTSAEALRGLALPQSLS